MAEGKKGESGVDWTTTRTRTAGGRPGRPAAGLHATERMTTMNDGPSKNPTGLPRTVVVGVRFDLLPRGPGTPRQAQGKEAEHSHRPGRLFLRETLVRAGLQLWEKLFYPR